LLADEGAFRMGLSEGFTAEEQAQLHMLAPRITVLSEQRVDSTVPVKTQND